jgi:hypothetical protein
VKKIYATYASYVFGRYEPMKKQISHDFYYEIMAYEVCYKLFTMCC